MVNVTKFKNTMSLQDAIYIAKRQSGYMEIQTAYPQWQMIATKRTYGIKGEEFVHLIIDGSSILECILYATEEDTFYNFEFVVFQTDENTQMIINTVSLGGALLTDTRIKTFVKRLNAKDLDVKSLRFKNPFFDEYDIRMEIALQSLARNHQE